MVWLKKSAKYLKNNQHQSHILSWKWKRLEYHLNLFYEANITLVPKLDKESREKKKTTDQYLSLTEMQKFSTKR